MNRATYLLRTYSRLLLIVVFLALVLQVPAKEIPKDKSNTSNKPNTELLAKMSDCEAPVAYTEFALNNVRFGLESSGKVWNRNGPSYEVPKVDPASGEPSVHSIYSGGLWIGGYSLDGNLKVAAVKFRQDGKTDYYSGPLSNNGYTEADNCDQYDRFYYANKTDVSVHRAYHQSVLDGTVDDLFPDGYVMPSYFEEWPGNNPDPNYEYRLAPFMDVNGDDYYEPSAGDYPLYDLDGAIDCGSRGREDIVPLFGDQTLWWVFNDNGGIHTETGGQPIGMEIQAQAFAYSTTDEINNMTFYNYVLINRGVQTLTNTYFGHWLDTDLGFSDDDFVGCDVQRGMGYTYNGYDNDVSGSGTNGYGSLPPALGVDFFEGPYQDEDEFYDNPLSDDLQEVNDMNGIPYEGLGIGFGDSIPDNERFGMTKFVYHNRDLSSNNGDPIEAIHYYNYLDGKWKNGEPMTYGSDGQDGTVPCNYMFPGDSDPLGHGVYPAGSQESWSEENNLGGGSGVNEPFDRRFLQSAGKFTLDPGEYNNITTGVVWVRPFAPREATLNALRRADDKAQSLFDNCFQILSGPDSPEMTTQELNQEIILYLTNNNSISNNYLEQYGRPPTQASFDILIPTENSMGEIIPEEEKHYKFQGYMIYQLKNGQVSSAELSNPDLARIQYQVDIEDGVAQVINWEDDPNLGIKVPVEAVNGADEGIRHSFSIREDLFATESNGLVNFKKYYFMAIAYAHNQYEEYNPVTLAGQALPFLSSRKSATGGIPVITAIPHNPNYESNGMVIQSSYGQILPVDCIEGSGNGGHVIDMERSSEEKILQSAHGLVDVISYRKDKAPVQVKVVDPLNVPSSKFQLRFYTLDEDAISDNDWEIESDVIGWYLTNEADLTDTIFSTQSIEMQSEQLILKYGISIQVEQYEYETEVGDFELPRFLEASIEHESLGGEWLAGLHDSDQDTEQNWIRSGANTESSGACDDQDPSDECYYLDMANVDPLEDYENILEGTLAPWHVASRSWCGPSTSYESFQNPGSTTIDAIGSVDIVFTSEKEHWTRVPVLEMQHFEEQAVGGAKKCYKRMALSVDKNGKHQLEGGDFDECTLDGLQLLGTERITEMTNAEKDQYKMVAWPTDDPSLHSNEELATLSFGMGWFPGYAIDIENGLRLNMAFGENSALPQENGTDMIWNPTSTIWNPYNQDIYDPNNARFGGGHYYYVFRNQAREDMRSLRMPQYDQGQFAFHFLGESSNIRRRVFRACTWVGAPLLKEGAELLTPEEGLIPSEVRIRVRVAKPYQRRAAIEEVYEDYIFSDALEPWTDDLAHFNWNDENGILDSDDFDPELFAEGVEPAVIYAENDWLPYYGFDTEEFSATSQVTDVISAALETRAMNVVPNPYYGASAYENTRLDNRVKIINLPERCIIRIYDTGGILVRTLDKDNPQTYMDWDLKNERNVPIASGVHIFHVEIPGIGEKVIKWMGVMRPTDLDNF